MSAMRVNIDMTQI